MVHDSIVQKEITDALIDVDVMAFNLHKCLYMFPINSYKA
jgi:hypothetical protein